MKTREWKEKEQILEDNIVDKKVIYIEKDTFGMFCWY